MVLNPPCAELRVQVAHGVSELREHEDLVGRVCLPQERHEGGEFRVMLGVPVAVLPQNAEELLRVGPEVLCELPGEEIGAQPPETTPVAFCVECIDLSGA